MLMAHGYDNVQSGTRQFLFGTYQEPKTISSLKSLGFSQENAHRAHEFISIAGITGGGIQLGIQQTAQTAISKLPPITIGTNNDWEQLSGILRKASKEKGNFGVGSATREQANALGRAWVGKGYRISSDGTALISADGMKQFRLPSFKERLGKTQANFERKLEGQTWNTWPSNGHLDITD